MTCETKQNTRISNTRIKTSAVSLLCLFVLLIGGCLNNKLVLTVVYNRADNQIRNEFNKLGKFESWQKSAFEKRLQTYHYWHRREELPTYATLLQQIKNKVQVEGATSIEDVTQWLDQVEVSADRLQSCYPAHFSIDLIKSLHPEQINFIERRFAREQRKNRHRHNSQTRDQRMQKRLNEITKWSSRFGFVFTPEQRRMTLRTMYNTVSVHNEYYRLTRTWNKRLFSMMRNKKSPSYDADMKAHIARAYHLIEDNHKDLYETNRRIWRSFLLEFESSLSQEQRSWMKINLGKLSRNLAKIAREDVSFKPHDDAELGCLPTDVRTL